MTKAGPAGRQPQRDSDTRTVNARIVLNEATVKLSGKIDAKAINLSVESDYCLLKKFGISK